MKKWFLLSILLGSTVCLRAAGTVEMATDFGFVSQGTPFYFGNAGFNLNLPQTSAPEGRNVIQVGIAFGPPNGGGGWGIGVPNGTSFPGYDNGALRFWMKTPNGIVMNIEIEHTSPGNKSSVFVPSTNNQWQEIVINLNGTGSPAFNQPVNVNNVRAVFLASTYLLPAGNFVAQFDDIRWTKPVSNLAVYPTVATVNPGSRRQFTVEGQDQFGEYLFTYSAFSSAGNIGTFSPFNPSAPLEVQSSRFTAGTTNGTLPFGMASFSTAAVITNTTTNIDQQWGLLSETIPGINLNADSFLGVSVGSGGGNVQINSSTTDKREGNESTFVSLNAPANGFAGFFIQHGISGTSDYINKDMSHYFDGSLRFWFKGPPALQNILQVSVRSANVPAGRELSKVELQNYVAFDNQWHPVVIPMTDFAGPRPWADLARTKVYAAFFAVGDTSGPQGIYIDNLRWDSRRPPTGPLVRIGISPNPVSVPLNSSRLLRAQGYDANGNAIDVYPSWTVNGAIGTLSASNGSETILSSVGTPVTGSITATHGGFSTTTVVNVADPVWTQSYNVYSDLGSGGYVGVSVLSGGAYLILSEQVLGLGNAPEGTTVRRSSYSVTTSNGWANWFTNVDNANGSRYMGYFDNGYLSFWVKTSRDLEVGIRSANIPAGTERSKFRLSELGVPLNNTFQRVVISMADFRLREPNLNFNQIQTFFSIGRVGLAPGENTFDIDDVKWLTAAGGAPDVNKVLTGLEERQRPSGLLQSYDSPSLLQAVTYDQALAAMAFTYHRDFVRARNIFNVYRTKFNAGGFTGFHDEYDVNNPNTVLDSDRIAGPNAWILLALLHYRNVSGDVQYDAMMDGVANWLLSLQDPGDGAIRFGFASGVHPNEKATEHNFDCYSAFQTYADVRSNNAFRTAANNIRNWLGNEAYVPAQQRFNVGEFGSTGLPNTDRALDAYSWAPLAMSSYTLVLPRAVLDLGTTRNCDLTGLPVTGFDFSGPIGQPVDKDAVWIEGTGQMAVAYYFTGQTALGDYYVNQLDKAVVNTSLTAQGLPYATNGGTAYGFNMNSLNPAVSAAAWYIFAKRKFNPLQPFPLYGVQIKNVSNNLPSSTISFSVNVPTRWVRSDQYLEFFAQPISIDPWGLQIYTNNTVAASLPRYIDPTPTNTINPDSDPSGLGWLKTGVSTTSHKLPLSWRVQDSSGPVPSAMAPYTLLDGGSGQAFNWFYTKDQATPAIDLNGNGQVGDPVDGTAFTNGEDYIIVRGPQGLHVSQGTSGYVQFASPDYIYLQADFGSAAAQETYQTNALVLEFFFQ